MSTLERAATRRGRGRPPIGPMLTGVRITQEVEDELERLAAEAGVKRAELVRELLDEALAARRRKAARAARKPDPQSRRTTRW